MRLAGFSKTAWSIILLTAVALTLAVKNNATAQADTGVWRLVETRTDSENFATKFTGCGSVISYQDNAQRLFYSHNDNVTASAGDGRITLRYQTTDCFQTDAKPWFVTGAGGCGFEFTWPPLPSEIGPGEAIEVRLKAATSDAGSSDAWKNKGMNCSFQDLAGGNYSTVSPPRDDPANVTEKTLTIAFPAVRGQQPEQRVVRAYCSSGALPGPWGEVLYVYEWVPPEATEDAEGTETGDATEQPTDSAGTENRPPSVALSASPDFPYYGDVVIFVAEATDPDGDPLTYEWTHQGVPVLCSGAALELPELPPGIHEITVTVSDGKGGTATAEFALEITSRRQIRISQPGTLRYPLTFKLELLQPAPDGKEELVGVPDAELEIHIYNIEDNIFKLKDRFHSTSPPDIPQDVWREPLVVRTDRAGQVTLIFEPDFGKVAANRRWGVHFPSSENPLLIPITVKHVVAEQTVATADHVAGLTHVAAIAGLQIKEPDSCNPTMPAWEETCAPGTNYYRKGEVLSLFRYRDDYAQQPWSRGPSRVMVNKPDTQVIAETGKFLGMPADHHTLLGYGDSIFIDARLLAIQGPGEWVRPLNALKMPATTGYVEVFLMFLDGAVGSVRVNEALNWYEDTGTYVFRMGSSADAMGFVKDDDAFVYWCRGQAADEVITQALTWIHPPTGAMYEVYSNVETVVGILLEFSDPPGGVRYIRHNSAFVVETQGDGAMTVVSVDGEPAVCTQETGLEGVPVPAGKMAIVSVSNSIELRDTDPETAQKAADMLMGVERAASAAASGDAQGGEDAGDVPVSLSTSVPGENEDGDGAVQAGTTKLVLGIILAALVLFLIMILAVGGLVLARRRSG